jgi:hypothetical protein
MKFVGLIMAFLVIVVLLFLSLGYISSQPVPDNSTIAGQQYENQSATVELIYTGVDGGLLLLILAFVLGAAFLIIKAIS